MNNLFWQPGMSLKDLEREAVKASLQFFNGNQQSAARALGITDAYMKEKVAENEQRERDITEHEYKRRIERDRFSRRQRGLPEDPVSASPAVATGAHTGATTQGQAVGPHAGARVVVQPTQDTSTQQPLSVPVGQKVQGVSSKSATRAGAGKNR